MSDNMLPALMIDSKLMPKSEEHQKLLEQSITSDWSLPDFKLKHFVMKSQIHPMHQVKQLMLELNGRQEIVESFSEDIQKLEIEIELEEEMRDAAGFKAQKKLHELEIIKKKKKLAISREKIRSAIHERDKFLKNIDEFNAGPNARDPETGLLYLEVLKDEKRCEEIEAKYWEFRLAKQSALDMIAYGRVGVGNMDAILQLEPDAQNRCLAMAYETLITNEKRLNILSDGVQKRLELGKPVSDMIRLVGIARSETLNQLQLELENNNNQGQNDVPLIQKY